MMATLAELIHFKKIGARVLGKSFKVRKVARPGYPLALEMGYVKKVRPYANDARKILEHVLAPKIRQLASEAGVNVKNDAYPDTLKNLMMLARSSYASLHSDDEMQGLASQVGSEVNKWNKRKILTMMGRAVGVDIFLADQGIKADLQAFVHQNVQLISSIESKYYDDVEQKLLTGLRAGTRVEDLQDIIQERWKVPAARAELIARDQVGKFNGQLTQLRHEELGIEEYTWRGVLDERERPEHLEREGDIFRWDSPPEGGHPGEDYQCRCSAEPVIRF